MTQPYRTGALTLAGINVSGYRRENWRGAGDGPLPLIVNPEADLHALVAWCWGETKDMELLVLQCLGANGFDMEALASLLFSRLPGVVSALEFLSDRTQGMGASLKAMENFQP